MKRIILALLLLAVVLPVHAQSPRFDSDIDGMTVPVGQWLNLGLELGVEETPYDGEVVVRGQGTHLKLSFSVPNRVLGVAGSVWCNPGSNRWIGQEACNGCGAGVLMDCRTAVATATVTPNGTSASFVWPLAVQLDVGEYEVEVRLDTDQEFHRVILGTFRVTPYEDWWRW